MTPFPSAIRGLRTIELTVEQAPSLQRFFDENPAYFLATQGEPAGPGEAVEEITGQLPAEMSYTKKWVFGYVADSGALAAMANIITDLLAPTVHHIATFIVATARHGSGDAQRLYDGLERWAVANGAKWLRLGVVVGNTRAERFWCTLGYLPLKVRTGVQMGTRSVSIAVMFKPLAGGSREEYLALVSRDRDEI